MKFFRSFQILHRRTKSATFESGPAGTDAPLNLIPPPKRSSLPTGSVSNGETPSIFGLVTSQEMPVPPAFSHLRPTTRVVPTALQTSSRPSRASLEVQIIAFEENARLREALNMWYTEYARVESLLQEHRSEIALERQQKEVLELQSAQNQDIIKDLKGEIFRQEVRLAGLREPKPPNACPRCSHELPDESPSILRSGITSRSTANSRLSRSMKNRTLDDYQSALRVTLSVRSQLRDQKKKAKFWKNKALYSGRSEGVVTPSSSAISSIHEPLTEERKAAVEALIRERGLVLPPKSSALSKENSHLDATSSSPQIARVPLHIQWPSSCVQENKFISPPQRYSPDEVTALNTSLTLTSAPSESSAISSSSCRLAPLASDSLKAEINTFFGIQESSSRWFSSSKPKGLSSSASGSSSIIVSSSPMPTLKPKSSTTKPPQVDLGDLTLPTEPYDDLGWIFQTPMHSGNNNTGSGHKARPCLPKVDSPWQILDLSGSTLADSSLPSGSSATFLQAFSDLTAPKPQEASPRSRENSEQSSWRWQKHLAKRQHPKDNSEALRSASKTVSESKVVDEGRKSLLGMKRPFSLRKKQSGLPVLSPGKP